MASCSSWGPVETANSLGALPVFPPNPSTMAVTGTATIWYYLDGEGHGQCGRKAP